MKWLKWTLIIGIAVTALYLIYSKKEITDEPFDEKNGINTGKRVSDKMRNQTLL